MVRPSKPPASLLAQALIATLVVALARPTVALASPPELLARVAVAASGPRVAVVVVSLDLPAAQKQGALEAAAEAALERAARFDVLSTHDAFNPNARKVRDQKLEESRARMKAGMQALEELDNVKATENLTQALEILQEIDLTRDVPAVIEAWVMKAAGHATGGENVQAKKDIEAVVLLAPKVEFSPTFFPPDLIKYAEAQRKFAANAKGELLVRTAPPGAQVWVDGVARGVSPVTVAGLTGTKHFVAASLGGYKLGQSQASPGETLLTLDAAELGPAWKKAVTAVSRDPDGETRDTAAQALGKAAQLDQVLVVLARKSLAGEQLDLTALRLEVRDGHNDAYRTGTVNPGDPEALAAFFDGLTGRDAKRDGKDPVHHYKGAGGSSVKTVVGFSLLGLGAVALVNGIVFGVLANDQATQFKQTPQTQTMVSQQLVGQGTTYAAVADISYLVGLAAAGTGGVLLLTNRGGAADEAGRARGKPSGRVSSDELKRQQLDKKAAEDRRASEERAQEDERRREDDRAREEQGKKDADAKAADEKRRADEEAAQKKPEETRPLSKKERAALEKKEREEEARAKREEEKRKAEETKAEARAKKEEVAREKAAAEERLKAEAERQKKEDEERKKREDAEKKKRDEDHDDLRNY